MRFRNRATALTFVLTVFSLLVAKAQDPAKPKVVDSGFRTLGWHVTADDLFYERSGKEVPLQIHDSARSSFFKLPIDKILTVYRKITDEEGEIQRQLVARADLSKAGRSPLVIFSADQKRDERFNCSIFRDDPTSFPAASYRFINLSSANLEARVASKIENVPAKGLALIKSSPDGRSKTRYVTITTQTQGKTQLLYANNWVLRPLQRTMVVISSVGGNAEVQRIVDTPSPM